MKTGIGFYRNETADSLLICLSAKNNSTYFDYVIARSAVVSVRLISSSRGLRID